MAMSSFAHADREVYGSDHRNEGESHFFRRLLTSVLIAIAFACGLGSGLLADDTSNTLLAYRADMPKYRVPAVGSEDQVRTAALDRTRPAPMPAAGMTNVALDEAWFPINNTMTWDIGLAPGQSLSGLSVRNSDSTSNMIVTLYVLAADGRWIRAGLLHVRAGNEAVVHPPVGSYAMTYTKVSKTTPYQNALNGNQSEVSYFDLADEESARDQPQTRFALLPAGARRLPDLRSYDDEDALSVGA